MLLYYLPIENEYFDTKLLNIVSQYRQEKISRYKFLLDKKLSLFSSLLIDMCISQLTSVHYSKLIYGKSIYGKPFLSSISNLHFNYSHTHSCILCGISFIAEIGVDIEYVATPPYDVMDLVFNTFEIEYVDKSHSSPDAFYKIWTRKEAYAKYTGMGLDNELSSIDTLSKNFPPYYHTWKYNRYICSVCSSKPDLYQKFLITEDMVKSYYFNMSK